MDKIRKIITAALAVLAIVILVIIYRDRFGENHEKPPIETPQITIKQPEVTHLARTPYDMSSNIEVSNLRDYQLIFDAPADYDPFVPGDYEMTVIADNNAGSVFTYTYILHVREPQLEVISPEVTVKVNQQYDLWSNVRVTSYDGTPGDPHETVTYSEAGLQEVTLEFEHVKVTYNINVTQ